MTIYDEIKKAKRLLEEKTGIDTKEIEFKTLSFKGEGYHLSQYGDKYTLKYIDERGGTHIICNFQPHDETKYHCFKLLVDFCSSEYFKYNKEPFDRFKMFEKQLEYMSLIDDTYTDRVKREIDQILENSKD